MAPLVGMALGKIVEKIANHYFPDAAQKADFEMKVSEMAQRGDFKEIDSMLTSDQGQVAINVEEAKSDDLFKSGWRPAVGWMCVAGLAYQFIIAPLATWIGMNALDWKNAP